MIGDERELAVLLRDVKDNPDDDTPRLILADWLQDAGDPRGELIHLQVRRHRLQQGDPAVRAMRRREWEILHQHGLRWVGPFVDRVSAWFFERGLLVFEARADRLLGDSLPTLEASDTCHWLEDLELRDIRPEHLDVLAHSPLVSHLVALDLRENRLGEHLAVLADSPHLGRLVRLTISAVGLRPGTVTRLRERFGDRLTMRRRRGGP